MKFFEIVYGKSRMFSFNFRFFFLTVKYFLNNALSLLSLILNAKNSIKIVHNKDLFLDCDTILFRQKILLPLFNKIALF